MLYIIYSIHNCDIEKFSQKSSKGVLQKIIIAVYCVSSNKVIFAVSYAKTNSQIVYCVVDN